MTILNSKNCIRFLNVKSQKLIIQKQCSKVKLILVTIDVCFNKILYKNLQFIKIYNFQGKPETGHMNINRVTTNRHSNDNTQTHTHTHTHTQCTNTHTPVHTKTHTLKQRLKHKHTLT